jgi:hypothetical protein
MSVKHVGIAALVAISAILPGCRREQADNRLVDVARRQKEQEADIKQVSKKVGNIMMGIDEIRSSLLGRDGSAGEVAAVLAAPERLVDFRKTPDYRKMAAALSAIQQQLEMTQTDVAQARETMRKELEQEREWERRREEEVRHHRQMFDSMKDPQVVTHALDALVRDFGQQIDDPARRQQFHDAVNYLKWLNSQNLSTQELRDALAQHLNDRLANGQDEESRRWAQRQIDSVSSLPNDLQSQASAQEVLDRVRHFENLDLLRQMKETHGIPTDVFEQAGLPTVFPRFKALDGGGVQMEMQSSFQGSIGGMQTSP